MKAITTISGRSATRGGRTSARSRSVSTGPTPSVTPVAARLTEAELLARYEPRIRGMAHRLMPRTLPTVCPDDLMQAGRIALIGVARRYDPAKGTPFGGYLQQRLRGAMLDFLDVEYARFYSAPRDGQWDPALTRRVHPAPDKSGSDGTELVPNRVDPTPERAAAAARLAALIGRATDVLCDRERTILCALFVRGLTLEQAGKLVGLGESRVCQIRAGILAKLKIRLRSLGISDLPSALF